MFKLLIFKKKLKSYNNYIIFSDIKYLKLNILCLKLFQFYRYKILTTISCVDFPELENRFELNYHLLSIDYNSNVILRINTSEFMSVDSLSNIFSSSIWLEREVWDMFGVFFVNNMDLRRILTDYGFPYHPLRKTFPLQGYMSINYDYIKKKILYIPNKIFQRKSIKNLENPWINIK